MIPFVRSAAAPGTGVRNPRQQINTISSYIDAFAVYGGDNRRLEWLRVGPVDGDLSNNSALLFLPGGYLPPLDSRATRRPRRHGDRRPAAGQPNQAVVAGDLRANENIALTAVQNLFAREHNRIVGRSTPPTPRLTEEQKFQIARRVVIAEQQFITYNEFLPAIGVRLAPYRGYNAAGEHDLSNEFATVGYRAHSQIHGEFELEGRRRPLLGGAARAFEAQGIEVIRSEDGTEIELAVPLNVAFFNPNLVKQLGLGPLLQGIGLEAQYNNDEMIDNQLRSVLFQIPVDGNPECLDGPGLPECFQRRRGPGCDRHRARPRPRHADVQRAAPGVRPRAGTVVHRQITGEATEAFPADPELTRATRSTTPTASTSPRWSTSTATRSISDSEEAETSAVDRRAPDHAGRAAPGVYGSVDRVDAFVGMVAEPHVAGTEFGELQLAIWTEQFEALRDGDRFFYGNDPGLGVHQPAFGIDFRRTSDRCSTPTCRSAT